jgi:MFS transporter, Spinster family, sphingosine-1-phosphate transporter
MSLRGGAAHRVYSVVVFVVLAALDNVAITLVPPLYRPIADEFGVARGAVSATTAVTFIVTAVAAVGWGYYGDRTNRKPLLALGTLLWMVGTASTGLAVNYPMFFAAQFVGAVGLGAVASVGFSVVSDLIAPRRRGIVMSLWGLSQGVGTLAGTLLASFLGADDWRRPFFMLTVVGGVATVAYLLTYDIRRGQSEPELAALFAAGGEYEHRISRDDLPVVLGRRTNVWLVSQGLSAQVTFGSLVWLPVLFQEKATEQGFDEAAAIRVGGLLATLFTLGGVLSIVGGLVGDRWQRRNPGGRAMVAAIGILAGIPLYIVLFFVPLRLDAPRDAGAGEVTGAVLRSLVTEPTVIVAFLSALLALGLTSANSPNWFALIADVNPPEHRGTVYSLGNLANGVGRAAGTGLVAVVFAALQRRYGPPTNVALGLAMFQLFFVPTGIMYWLASRTSPGDIETVRELLRERSASAVDSGRGVGELPDDVGVVGELGGSRA